MTLRGQLAEGEKAERELEILQPRLDLLRMACHDEWEDATSPEIERECKQTLRVVRNIERLFQTAINGAKQARKKLERIDG